MNQVAIETLRSDFVAWRKTRRGKTERVPPELLARAKVLSDKIGVTAVAKASGLPKRYFEVVGPRPPMKKISGFTETKPSLDYTKVQLSPPPSHNRGPLVEIENQKGVKLRLFALTPETLQLAASFSDIGGLR